jgi:hypothetical protein
MRGHTRGNPGPGVCQYQLEPIAVADAAMNTYLMALRVTDIHRTRGEAGGMPNATRQALHGAMALRRGKRLVDRDARIGPSQVTLQLTPVEPESSQEPANTVGRRAATRALRPSGFFRASAETDINGGGGIGRRLLFLWCKRGLRRHAGPAFSI